jgi:hypothetical protein
MKGFKYRGQVLIDAKFGRYDYDLILYNYDGSDDGKIKITNGLDAVVCIFFRLIF